MIPYSHQYWIHKLFVFLLCNQPTHNNIPNPPPLHCRISSFTSTLPPPFHHEQYHPPSWSYHRFSPFLWNCLAVDMFNLHCPASDLFLSLPPYAAFLCCLKSVTPQCLFILFGMLSLASPFFITFFVCHILTSSKMCTLVCMWCGVLKEMAISCSLLGSFCWMLNIYCKWLNC